MPTVISEGRFQFKIYTRELEYEPPHVHVFIGREDACRIDLDSGNFMDEPPPGEARAILRLYATHAAEIRRVWDDVHGR